MRIARRLGLVLGVAAVLGACGGDDPDREEQTEGHGVRIDERQIRASITGTKLEVGLTLERTAAAPLSGKVKLALVDIGVGSSEGEAEAAFTLDAASREVKLGLTAPPTTSVGDLGRYVLRYIVELEGGELYGKRSLFMAVRRHGLMVIGNNHFVVGEKSVLRVIAVHPASGAGVPGTAVKLLFSRDSNKAVARELASGSTNALGELEASFTFQTSEVGAGTIKVAAGSLTSEHSVVIEQPRQILLTTDKPLYQPGQTVVLRAMALGQPRLTPLGKEKLLLEVEDPQGNKLFKESTTTDTYGIASLRFALARLVLLGTYKARVTMGAITREKTFEVKHYTLPKFKVTVTLDKSGYLLGETVTGTVQADYFFNKHVQGGTVKVSAYVPPTTTAVSEVQGKTDSTGKLGFTLTAPAGSSLVVEASVTDVSGAEVKGSASATLGTAAEKVVLQAMPEQSAVAAPGPLTVYALVTDIAGKPLAGTVSLSGAASGSAKLSAGGLAVISGKLASCYGGEVTVAYLGSGGASASTTFTPQCGTLGLVLSTDRALYAENETATVSLVGPAALKSAQVEVVRANTTVTSFRVTLAQGKGSAQLELGSGLTRTLEIKAHALSGESMLSDQRLIYVRGADQLNVKVSTDKSSYRPAESAKVTLQLSDSSGKGTAGALGVQIVDEALYAMTEFKPGLERRYFLLEEDVVEATRSLRFLGADTLLSQTPSADDQIRARMLFAAAGQRTTYPIQYRSQDQDLPRAIEASQAGMRALTERMTGAFKAAFSGFAGYGASASTMSAWCESWVGRRVDDFGQHYQVVTSEYSATIKSAGMDETWSTGDDLTGYLSFSVAKPPKHTDDNMPAYSKDAGWGGYADAGSWGYPDAASGADAGGGSADGASRSDSGSTPKIRQYFPETLYVNPALITDGQGKATIDLALADSITTWRLSSIAHTLGGQLGSTAAGITVFQEFFLDTLLPKFLVQNDEVDVPVVVYNYTGSAQTVSLSVASGSWFDLLDAATQQVSVPAKSVSTVKFRIRVKQVGVFSFTATGTSATDSDGIKRSVEVLPDGEKQEVVHSGMLLPGKVSHTVTIPATAIDGASDLFVRVFPGLLAEVVHGFEALLKQPYGCFEQTSSSTYPNVMVLQYLKAAGLSTPALEQKAKGYIEQGYQRLVTYEVPGGGFSLYGQAPAGLFLSAFGLLEFADMAKVAYVDPSLISRTQSWLAGQQQSDGSFTASTKGFYGSSTSAEDTPRLTAYVAWALAKSGYTGAGLGSALSYLKQKVSSSEDSYTLALAANALLTAGGASDPTGQALLAKLRTKAVINNESASWPSSACGLAYSYGDAMEIEVTALAIGALLLGQDKGTLVAQGLKFLAASKDSYGSYGNTQATVLALRALLLALAAKGGNNASGTIQVAHNGSVQQSATVTTATSDVTRLFDLKSVVLEGSNAVELTFSGTGELAYQVVGIYYLPHGSGTGKGPLSFAVSYDKTTLKVNDTLTITATLKSTAGEIPTVLARVGLPPGFTVNTSDFTPAKTGNVVQYAEEIGPHLVLYLGHVSTTEQTVTIQAIAGLAVKGQAPPSVAYPYYTPEFARVVDTPVVTVTQ